MTRCRGSERWLAYPLAVALLAGVFVALDAIQRHLLGPAEWCVALALAGAAVAAPLGLVVWARGIGVRVSAAGVVSVGRNSAVAIGWHEVRRFFIDDRGPNRIAVYAGLADGSRVELHALSGWRWQRPRLQRSCDELAARLTDAQSRASVDAASESFARVPWIWRRRLRSVDTRVSAV